MKLSDNGSQLTQASLLGVTSACARRRQSLRWILVLLLVSACASVTVPVVDTRPSWTSVSDCFERSVAVPSEAAERMAATCAGEQASGNVLASGIERANAAFNAAAAFNALSVSGQANVACGGRNACARRALGLIMQSYANQQDYQVDLAGDDKAGRNARRFVMRRAMEKARALWVLSDSGGGAAECGDRDSCVRTASETLDDIESVWSGLDTTPELSLLCDMLNLRWQINTAARGSQDHQVAADLQRIQRECPALAGDADEALAGLAFERAERMRAALLASRTSLSATPEVMASLSEVIADYRSAARSDRFALAARRGAGETLALQARLDPGVASTVLTAAVEEFETAAILSAGSSDPTENAADLARLGESLVALAMSRSDGTSLEGSPWLVRAVVAFQQSISLLPSSDRQHKLGEALLALNRLEEARDALEAALPGLSPAVRSSARFSLSNVYERLGDPDAAYAMMREAAATGGLGVDGQYRLGRLAFVRRDFTQSRFALLAALDGLSGRERAEAGYMLSVLEVSERRDGWRDRARAFAEIAVGSGEPDWKFRRQDCLSAILAGGEAVITATSVTHCPDIAFPEAQLLRGMFYLRQAQMIEVDAYDAGSQNAWRALLRSAEDAFLKGQSLSVGTVSASQTRFDDLPQAVRIDDRLAEGLRVVKRCRREITIAADSAEWTELQRFFGHYGVLKCSAS